VIEGVFVFSLYEFLGREIKMRDLIMQWTLVDHTAR